MYKFGKRNILAVELSEGEIDLFHKCLRFAWKRGLYVFQAISWTKSSTNALLPTLTILIREHTSIVSMQKPPYIHLLTPSPI